MYNYNRSNLKNSWHACTLVCMLCSDVYYYVLLRDTPLLRVMNHYKCKSHTVKIASACNLFTTTTNDLFFHAIDSIKLSAFYKVICSTISISVLFNSSFYKQ